MKRIYSIKDLQQLHEQYEKLTKWQVKRVRSHARTNRPRHMIVKPLRRGISLNKVNGQCSVTIIQYNNIRQQYKGQRYTTVTCK